MPSPFSLHCGGSCMPSWKRLCLCTSCAFHHLNLPVALSSPEGNHHPTPSPFPHTHCELQVSLAALRKPSCAELARQTFCASSHAQCQPVPAHTFWVFFNLEGGQRPFFRSSLFSFSRFRRFRSFSWLFLSASLWLASPMTPSAATTSPAGVAATSAACALTASPGATALEATAVVEPTERVVLPAHIQHRRAS